MNNRTHTTVAPENHLHRRRGLIAALAGLTAVVTAFGIGWGSESAHAAAGWQWWNTDADSCADIATLDTDYNGNINELWSDLDNDCRLDTHLWDTGSGDWLLEAVTFDMNEDGRWETWFADNNQAAGFDYVYYDYNRDGRYDSYTYIGTTRSVADMMSLINNPTGYGAPTYPMMASTFAFNGIYGRVFW